jgi:hypothetical protein
MRNEIIYPPHVTARWERRRLGFLRDMDRLGFTVQESDCGVPPRYCAWKFACDNLVIIYSPSPDPTRYWPAFCEILEWQGGMGMKPHFIRPDSEKGLSPNDFSRWHFGYFSFCVPSTFGWVVNRPKIQFAVDMEMALDKKLRNVYFDSQKNPMDWRTRHFWAPWAVKAKGLAKGPPDFNGLMSEWLEPLGSLVDPGQRTTGWKKIW